MRKSNIQQWSFSTSQFLSFKSAPDQGGTHKQYPAGYSQRNLGLDIPGGSQYPVTRPRWLPKLSANNQSPEVRTFPAAGQADEFVPFTIGSAVGAATTIPNVSVMPPTGPVVGSTDLKSSPSIRNGSCQLTLFYNGSVCVYDNVSPEKAQAIMLLAGDGESKNPPALAAAPSSLPKVQSLGSLPRMLTKDTTALNRSSGLLSTVPLPAPVSSLPAVSSSCAVEANPIKRTASPMAHARFPVSLPTPVSSLPASPSGCAVEVNPIRTTVASSVHVKFSVSLPTPVCSIPAVPSSCAVEVNPIKPILSTPAHLRSPEPQKSGFSEGAGGVKACKSVVPQARKASLARFLEKRKERVTGASPYAVNKNASDCSTASGRSTLKAKSASLSPLPATL